MSKEDFIIKSDDGREYAIPDINKFDGINITIGSRFLRASPDHGTADNIIDPKNIHNISFKKCINFFSL